MVQSSNQRLTLEEFLALPEGDITYEFVNGEAVPKYKDDEISPKFFHGSTTGALFILLSAWAQAKGRVDGRSSYVFWEEDGISPILALEVVSQTYNGEYEQKKIDYAELGILYYVIYAPTRLLRKRQRLEVYRLVEGKYIWLFRRCYAEIETIIRDLPLTARFLGSFNLDFISKAQNPSLKAIFLVQ